MFWDYASQNPESIHQFMILFSDRGIPAGHAFQHSYAGHTSKFRGRCNSNRRPALPPTTDHQDYAFASGLRRDLPNIVTERTAQVASGAGARSWSSRVALSLGASLPSPFFPVDQTADQIRYRPLPTWPSLSHSRRPKL
ncbi:unnamed protein product [Tilletia caries]|nr:unnamed protein product [Tilletia caries]